MRTSQGLRLFCFSALVAMATISKAECVYKSAMTDAEIAACKTAPPPPPEKHRATQAEVDAISREMFQKAYEDGLRKAAEPKAPKAPVEPSIGMTLAEADAMSAGNAALLRKYQASHAIGDIAGWDRRWGLWSSCKRNVTKTTAHERQQWVCGDIRDRHYLYFKDGILTAIEEPSY
jgi:hypothetical protein